MSGGADMSSSAQRMASTPHGSTTSPLIIEEFYVNDDDRVAYVNLENEEEESEPAFQMQLEMSRGLKMKVNHQRGREKKYLRFKKTWNRLKI